MYKSLIVSLNEIESIGGLIDSAAELACDRDSHLTGLYVLPAMRIFPEAQFEPLPEMFGDLRRYFDDHAEMAKTVFESSLARLAMRGEFRIVDAQSPMIADTFSARARRFELAVVSKVNRDADLGVELDFVPSVLLACGRPVLVVPRLLRSSYGKRAVVGWNGSRESARAVFDALPLLSMFDEVDVLTIQDGQCMESGGIADSGEVKDMLSGYCPNVVARTMPGQDRNPGSLLLAHASLLGARLLVMGAYGRGRLAELVLGGATRHVLGEMRIPVLFSH